MRYLLILLGVAAAIGAYTAYWFTVANQAEIAVKNAIVEGTPDVALAADNMVMSGYPYRITGLISEPRATARDGTWRWTAPELEIFAQPYNLGHLIISAPGPHTFNVAPPLAPRQTFNVTTETARASLLASENGPSRIDASVEGAAATASTGETLNVSHIELHARPHPDVAGATQAAAIVRNMSGSALLGAPIGGEVTLAQIVLRFDGVADLPMLEPFAQGRWPRYVRQIDIEQSGLVWGPLTVTGMGQISLNASNQPEGAIQLVIDGHEGAIAEARANGAIEAGFAATLNTALGVMGVLSGDADGRVSVNLVLRGGFAYLGPVRVFATGVLR